MSIWKFVGLCDLYLNKVALTDLDSSRTTEPLSRICRNCSGMALDGCSSIILGGDQRSAGAPVQVRV